MASPQIENGYTKLANELLDAFCAVSLSSHEWNVMHAVIRKTYGYNKKEDWVTNTQIMKLTGQTQQKVSQAKRKLVKKKILTENGNKISLNKNYEEWEELPKTVTRVTENGNKQLPKTVNTKEKKDNINKLGETSSPELKDNSKDMPWNKQSDDFDEGVIDLDGDGTLKEEKKTPTRKYPNAPAIRKIFQEVLGRNEANWKINKNQLLACENLFTERGEQKVRNALEWWKEHKDLEFCPKVDSPYDLDSKYVKLSQFKTKHEHQ